ncbi:MAG: TOBE domain-containing protein [Burkholderiaceae bacterium]
MVRSAVKAPPTAALDGALWLRHGGQALGGADRVALLEAIGAHGSMTHAARAVGISYKTAWERVQGMNNVAAQPLVARSAGGAGGGGTTLTPYAIELIGAFRELEQAHAQMLGRLSKSLAQPGAVLQTLAALGLRTSARNQLAGTVTKIERGAVNAAVELGLPGGGDRVHATLTLGSLRELGLKKGVHAVALIKAPSVFLAPGDGAPQLSVRNALAGTVTKVVRGAVNTEVQACLQGGQTMVAMVSLESRQRLGLRAGAPVRLVFQESSVILGVA